MIPKAVGAIEWQDIELLKDSGREEDDTIEYKEGFSGGSDFLALNDSQTSTAIAQVAKAVVAFMNGRGGDLIIGVSEAENDHPKIKAITPIENVDASADRLAQSLVALIEPAQSVLAVRAIKAFEDSGEGVIVVRAPASLRAPHRFSRTKECYIRRGRQSVPMPMDEIQDLTLTRSSRRAERLSLLDSHFDAMKNGHIGRMRLVSDRMHFRIVYVPISVNQILIDQQTLSAMMGRDPILYPRDGSSPNDVAFRNVWADWKPILRGKRSCFLNDHQGNQIYSGKEIYESGVMITDYSDNRLDSHHNRDIIGMHFDCILGYLANSLVSFNSVFELYPEMSDGALRVGFYFPNDAQLVTDRANFGGSSALLEGLGTVPDFEVTRGENLNEIFKQLQIDVRALAGLNPAQIYSLTEPE